MQLNTGWKVTGTEIPRIILVGLSARALFINYGIISLYYLID